MAEGVKISELEELSEINGEEYIPIAYNGQTKKVKTSKVRGEILNFEITGTI